MVNFEYKSFGVYMPNGTKCFSYEGTASMKERANKNDKSVVDFFFKKEKK